MRENRIDATVHAEGCRIESVSAAPGETEVRLREGLRVRLALPTGVRPPAPPLFLGARLEGTAWDRSPWFDERGEIVTYVGEPGPRAVLWCYQRVRADCGSGDELALPHQTVWVEDRPDEQRLELAVTSEALAAALAAR
jgi:hypothetical protein